MNAIKNSLKITAVLVAGLAFSASGAYAQSATDRLGKPGHQPPSSGTCSLSRSCSPGASINVIPYLTGHRNTGTLRLQIRPANADVYVDGVYAGRAEDFDTALAPGSHRIEVSADGYVQMNFATRIKKSRTTIHRATLSPAFPKP